MARLTRRESLKLLALAPLAAGFTWSGSDAKKARERLDSASSVAPESFAPEFFTPHEFDTVRLLADMILPADERSGSATDAGVPEFMDFMMIDRPVMQTPMRGGLAWIDYQCVEAGGTTFLESSDEVRRALLDQIAFPDTAPSELTQGVAFFNSFRDLTASGFWTSRMGVDDLQYMGNVFVPEWTGCPAEALERLGVSYDD